MNDSPVAFKGIAAPEFPNYFFSAGPNGLAINASYFANVERNVKTIVTLLKTALNNNSKTIVVKQEVNTRYNAWLATQFDQYSWGNPSCTSYYRTEDGHVPFLFPGGYKDYVALHEQTSLNDFDRH